MVFSDEIELAVSLYMADVALPRQATVEKLLKAGLEGAGYLTGDTGRPPEIIDGQPSSDYVQYSTYLDEDR